MTTTRRCAECDHFRPAFLWRPLDPLLDSTRLFQHVGGCASDRNERRLQGVILHRAVSENDCCSDFVKPEPLDALFDSLVYSDEQTENKEEHPNAENKEEDDPRQLGLFVRPETLTASDSADD